MFKYVLLLKEYLKKMPHYHKDHNYIVKAQSVFEDINQNSNELMNKL